VFFPEGRVHAVIRAAAEGTRCPPTASVSYTEAAEATGPGDLRLPPHPRGLRFGVWPGDPPAAAGVIGLAGAG
jgi:hypothetical protein